MSAYDEHYDGNEYDAYGFYDEYDTYVELSADVKKKELSSELVSVLNENKSPVLIAANHEAVEKFQRYYLTQEVRGYLDFPRNWNLEFQALVRDTRAVFESKNALGDKDVQSVRAWYSFMTAFKQCAVALGCVVILESALCIPNDARVIPAADNVGGVAGGEKFIAGGLFFKRVNNLSGIFQNESDAIKSLNNELIGLKIFATDVEGVEQLQTALSLIVDYCGFRVCISSVLDLGSQSSRLVYGSDDGGRTVFCDNEVSNLMKRIGARAGLGLHGVGPNGEVSIVGPCDLEIHQTGQQLIVLDTARVMPAQCSSLFNDACWIPDDLACVPLTSSRQILSFVDFSGLKFTSREIVYLRIRKTKQQRFLHSEMLPKLFDPVTRLCLVKTDEFVMYYANPSDPAASNCPNTRVTLIAKAKSISIPAIRGPVLLVFLRTKQHLVSLMRPEFVRHWASLDHGAPLSSDVYSGFGRHEAALHNANATRATLYLYNERLREFAEDVEAARVVLSSSLSQSLHERGLNVRMLGRLYGMLRTRDLKIIILEEMIARVLKHLLRTRLREAWLDQVRREEALGSRASDMDVRQFLGATICPFLDSIFSQSKDASNLWETTIPLLLVQKFGFWSVPNAAAYMLGKYHSMWRTYWDMDFDATAVSDAYRTANNSFESIAEEMTAEADFCKFLVSENADNSSSISMGTAPYAGAVSSFNPRRLLHALQQNLGLVLPLEFTARSNQKGALSRSAWKLSDIVAIRPLVKSIMWGVPVVVRALESNLRLDEWYSHTQVDFESLGGLQTFYGNLQKYSRLVNDVFGAISPEFARARVLEASVLIYGIVWKGIVRGPLPRWSPSHVDGLVTEGLESVEGSSRGDLLLRALQCIADAESCVKQVITNMSAITQSLPYLEALAHLQMGDVKRGAAGMKRAYVCLGETNDADRLFMVLNLLVQLEDHLEHRPLASPMKTEYIEYAFHCRRISSPLVARDINIRLYGSAVPYVSWKQLRSMHPDWRSKGKQLYPLIVCKSLPNHQIYDIGAEIGFDFDVLALSESKEEPTDVSNKWFDPLMEKLAARLPQFVDAVLDQREDAIAMERRMMAFVHAHLFTHHMTRKDVAGEFSKELFDDLPLDERLAADTKQSCPVKEPVKTVSPISSVPAHACYLEQPLPVGHYECQLSRIKSVRHVGYSTVVVKHVTVVVGHDMDQKQYLVQRFTANIVFAPLSITMGGHWVAGQSPMRLTSHVVDELKDRTPSGEADLTTVGNSVYRTGLLKTVYGKENPVYQDAKTIVTGEIKARLLLSGDGFEASVMPLEVIQDMTTRAELNTMTETHVQSTEKAVDWEHVFCMPQVSLEEFMSNDFELSHEFLSAADVDVHGIGGERKVRGVLYVDRDGERRKVKSSSFLCDLWSSTTTIPEIGSNVQTIFIHHAVLGQGILSQEAMEKLRAISWNANDI